MQHEESEMPNRAPVVGDVFEKALPAIGRIHAQFDLDLVLHPDLYGPPSKSVVERVRRRFRAEQRSAKK